MPKFKYIDLFAGIGGFHQAMRSLSGECLMAAETNPSCVETYNMNYTTIEKEIRGDVNKIDPTSIAKFDVLCAGFPCQPFSKAGYQRGFEDEGRGDLFFRIIDILDKHKEVKFIILENVRTLADKEENWNIIKEELIKKDFFITEEPIILSPSDFGLPQIRERVYILGIKKTIKNNTLLTNGCIHIEDLNLDNYYKKCEMNDAWSILDEDVSDDYIISQEEEDMIFAWDEFRKATKIGIIGYPIWLNSFGIGITNEQYFKRKHELNKIPDWKKRFILNNRALYLKNKKFIDKWIKKHDMLNRIKLHQKFEWNCGTDVNDIRNTIIQIRQSGIRVKRPTYYPSLVAMANTPIIWDEKKNHFRYITQYEAAKLQNFNTGFKFPRLDKTAYRQLGNSVNVKIIKILAKRLFALANDGWEDVQNGEKD